MNYLIGSKPYFFFKVGPQVLWGYQAKNHIYEISIQKEHVGTFRRVAGSLFPKSSPMRPI